MNCPRALAIAGALAATVVSAPASGYRINDDVEVFGYTQVWFTAWEQMEDVSSLVQNPAGHPAADSLTGFSVSKARLGLRWNAPRYPLQLYTQVKLEKDFALLDLAVRWLPRKEFGLEIGQFKTPGTFEALTDDRSLDFILRTNISNAIGDFSLSRSAHPASLFYGSASNFRDLGVAARGELDVGGGALRYFLMAGNGLGANLYFGGNTKREYLITNKAQLYWGGRVELANVLGPVTLGGHVSRNRHDDMVFNSGRVVYDLHRTSASADVRAVIPGSGVRLSGLYGQGAIDDDFNGDGRTDLRYSGWAAAGMWDLEPALQAIGKSLPDGIGLELGFRYDHYRRELDESGDPVKQDFYTVGANGRFGEHLRLMVDYVIKKTEDPSRPGPANNILFASFQATF